MLAALDRSNFIRVLVAFVQTSPFFGKWMMRVSTTRAIADPNINKHVGKYYGAWDMKTATQSFRREVTAELIQAIGGKG